jgi:hypothetical protein
MLSILWTRLTLYRSCLEYSNVFPHLATAISFHDFLSFFFSIFLSVTALFDQLYLSFFCTSQDTGSSTSTDDARSFLTFARITVNISVHQVSNQQWLGAILVYCFTQARRLEVTLTDPYSSPYNATVEKACSRTVTYVSSDRALLPCQFFVPFLHDV